MVIMVVYCICFIRAAQGKFVPVHGDLPGRSGAIQAAIHLELPSSDMTHVNVLIGKGCHVIRRSVLGKGCHVILTGQC